MRNGQPAWQLVAYPDSCGCAHRGSWRSASGHLARPSGLNVNTIVEVSDGTLARVRSETETAILPLTMQAAADVTLSGRWASVPGGPI